MTHGMMPQRKNTALRVIWFLLIALSIVYTISLAPAGILRWINTTILLIMALLYFALPGKESPDWHYHIYLATQGGLVAALLYLQPSWSMFTVLYCPLSVQAVLRFSRKIGGLWIAVFSLTTAGSFVYGMKLADGFTALVMYGGIYAFFGAYAATLRRIDSAHQESQALLAELQEVHRQMQEYSLRAEELAVIEERHRLAREMHDTLGHRLTVTSVQLEGAQRLIAVEPERAAGMIATVREQVREALKELRQTVAALRQPLEIELSLRQALNHLTVEFEKATPILVHQLLPDEIPDLPDSHRLALFRAAQEALTNVQKHAQAKQVWLTLMVQDGRITLLVSDNGVGLASNSHQKSGFGLLGLEERVSQLDGELTLESRPGGGAQLHFSLPLPPDGFDKADRYEKSAAALEPESHV